MEVKVRDEAVRKEFENEREFDAAMKRLCLWPTDKNFRIWQASHSAAIQECADLVTEHALAGKHMTSDALLALKER